MIKNEDELVSEINETVVKIKGSHHWKRGLCLGDMCPKLFHFINNNTLFQKPRFQKRSNWEE